MNTQEYYRAHAKLAERHNAILPELHRKFNTKRGLRNDDGTGVLIGLTEIGEVRGYIIDDQERVPTEGKLFYRGIDIEEVVHGFFSEGRFGFEEVAYLLLFGDLPNADELKQFQERLSDNRSLPDGFTEDMILRAPSRDVMNKLGRSILAAYSYDENAEDLSIENVLRQSVELIARFPTFVAYAYQAKRHYFDEDSLFIHAPDPALSTAENLLQMIRPDQKYSELEAQTLDLALVLHAEHGGGNNSAFTTHVVSSAATDTYSAISAAVGSLKGAKHGGASNRVIGMMDNIKTNVKDWDDQEEVEAYLTKVLRKEAGDGTGLIYGLGHAVYTVSDPRAALLREQARALAKEKGFDKEMALYDVVALKGQEAYKREKQTDRYIAPNVDFFSGFVYSMLDIPRELFTPIFAVARVAGWSAHRIEEMVSGGRIIRPAYKNVSRHRHYQALDARPAPEL